MDPPQGDQRAPLIDQFVVVVSKVDEGVFQSFNKFVYPSIRLSGSSFGLLPEFAFPDHEAVKNRQDDRLTVPYYFCLTRGPDKFQFAVCRRLYPLDKSFPVCICVLSSYPWFDVLDSVLEKIESVFFTHLTQFTNLPEVINFLDGLLACKPPEYGRVTLSLPAPAVGQVNQLLLAFEVPQEERKFGRPPLKHFLKPLSPSKLMSVFAALLAERRIIVHSVHVDRLTHFIFGLTALLYPLSWMNTFSPILCERGLDHCSAPMPFLFGVHSSLVPSILQLPLESVTWVNLDNNTVENPEDDIKNFRSPMFNLLTKVIESERAKVGKKSTKPPSAVSWNAFISFWTAMLVPCIKKLHKRADEKRFDLPPDADFYLQDVDAPVRELLSHIAPTQPFQQYVGDLLALLSKGQSFEGTFDKTASGLTTVTSPAALDSYYEAIRQQGLSVVANIVPSRPAPANAPVLLPRPSSPPVAIFTNALTNETDKKPGSAPRMLPKQPNAGIRPMASSTSAAVKPSSLSDIDNLRATTDGTTSHAESSMDRVSVGPLSMPRRAHSHGVEPPMMSSSFASASYSSASSVTSNAGYYASPITSAPSSDRIDSAPQSYHSDSSLSSSGAARRDSSKSTQLLTGRPWEVKAAVSPPRPPSSWAHAQHPNSRPSAPQSDWKEANMDFIGTRKDSGSSSLPAASSSPLAASTVPDNDEERNSSPRTASPRTSSPRAPLSTQWLPVAISDINLAPSNG